MPVPARSACPASAVSCSMISSMSTAGRTSSRAAEVRPVAVRDVGADADAVFDGRRHDANMDSASPAWKPHAMFALVTSGTVRRHRPWGDRRRSRPGRCSGRRACLQASPAAPARQVVLRPAGIRSRAASTPTGLRRPMSSEGRKGRLDAWRRDRPTTPASDWRRAVTRP